VTVELAAGPPPSAAKRHLGTAAVEFARPDDVIVIEQRTGIDAAGWGGILSRAAHRAGIAGTIVDGPVRDVEEAIELGYTVYARSSTARTARGRIHEVDCQGPIRLGDITVLPSDYVAADRSGCVVVPAGRIAEVLERAEAIQARSAEMAAEIDKGRPVSTVMDAGYETMLARNDGNKHES
jgi:4-hydroxy-4-methyl-2-oxoglutarate aldolase